MFAFAHEAPRECVYSACRFRRVYSHIIHALVNGHRLRLMVQASAGTGACSMYSTHCTRTSHSIAHAHVRTRMHTLRGKSFLLTTVYLYCLVHKIKVKAACPTGIAAANIEIEKTAVTATTIHNMFEFDGEYKSRLDFARLTNAKVADLITMEVLLLDEAPPTHRLPHTPTAADLIAENQLRRGSKRILP